METIYGSIYILHSALIASLPKVSSISVQWFHGTLPAFSNCVIKNKFHVNCSSHTKRVSTFKKNFNINVKAVLFPSSFLVDWFGIKLATSSSGFCARNKRTKRESGFEKSSPHFTTYLALHHSSGIKSPCGLKCSESNRFGTTHC